MLEYDELRIRVRSTGPGRYLVVANGPASSADVIVVDGEPAQYRDRFNHLIEIELGRVPTGDTHVAAKLRKLGRDIFDLLLTPPLADCVAESLQLAQSQRPPRGLRLRFDLPPELQNLPIEAITSPATDPQQSWALNHHLSLVRSCKGDTPESRLPDASAEPDFIHLLVAVAAPTDAGLRRLDPSAELAELRRELPEVTFRTTVERGTRKRIEDWLHDHADQPAVVLLIAYGDYDETRDEGVVYLETEDSATDRVPGHLLSGLLMRAQQLRLVVLNLCSGARSTRSEPFAGLAQSLIGRGIPAVVAMQDQVTDMAATLFSPALLECISSNKTIDEAVSTARQHVSEIPGHTVIEWTTPALFLHESYSHGWLFKAREVRDDRDERADPLRDADDALRRYESPGNVSPATVLAAARCLRSRGDWQGVQRVTRTRRPSAEQRRLIQEAGVELVWQQIEQLCAVLADGGDPALAGRLVGALRTQLPDDLAGCLARELDEFELDRIFVAAQEDLDSENWAPARAGYAQILARRPGGYRNAAALAEYVQGRAAQSGEKWALAVESYQRCLDVGDAPARLAYVTGRVAADAGQWSSALHSFATAAQRGLAEDGWLGYVTGRSAEDDEAWSVAADAYQRGSEFRDSTERLRYAQGRLAVLDDAWLEALAAFQDLVSLGWEVQSWAEQARDRVYQLAVAAEEAACWELAVRYFSALPAEVGDARMRCCYAEGRAAELAGDWPLAGQRYAATEHADAPLRMQYARGRACEQEQQWEQARDYFAGLPAHLLDVAHRLLYVTGRRADQDADFPGVIEGFGRLPDAYEQGDVGNRRRFARAWIAEQKSEWGSVLAHLEGIADDDRDGAVGLLRCKARGKQAEIAGDWSLAVQEYAAGSDADKQLRRLHCYATGRAAEGRQAWAEARDAYTQVPDELEDVGLRRIYVQARLIDQEAVDPAGWERTVEAYASLPADFADVSARAGHARMRLAESLGDWEGVAREAEALGGDPEAELLGHYARGRLAERDGGWPDAAQAYRQCADHLDAASREAHASGRVLESSGQWSPAIEAYQRSDLAEAGERRRRLTRLREALPWADGLTSAGLVADPCALADPTFPYLALRDAGVTPGSPTDVVLNAPFALMERGEMSFQERVAWDQLQLPGKRLQLDALLYQFRDFRGLQDQLARLPVGDPHELVDELCRSLPDDAALLILLAKGREEAISAWEQRLRCAPADMAVVHCLAVVHFWSAQELEESGAWELAGLAWERALACWAALLTEDDYWTRWRQRRAECFRHPVSSADSDRLRWELGKSLFDRLSGYAERHAGHGRPEHADVYQELIHFLERELEGAQALKEAGGLPLPGDPGATLVCGHAYLRVTGLDAALGELVARLETSAREGEDPGEPELRRLRCAFSELAQAFTFSQRHRFEQSLRVIPEALHQRALVELAPDCAGQRSEHVTTCAHCQDFLRNNPAYTYLPHRRARLLQDGVDLAVRAHLAIARAALTGGDGGLERAVEQWAMAIRISANAAMPIRTKRAILRMVLGRAEALAEEAGAAEGACLDEAIGLVESAVSLLGGLGREALLAKLAVLLTSRGVWHGYGCRDFGFQRDMDLAGADLRRAVELNPGSARARDYLARTLVFRPEGDTSDDKLRLLGEAVAILDDGLNRAFAPRLLDTLRDALEELQALLFSDLSIGDLSRLIEEFGADVGDSTARAVELLESAEQKLRDGDVTGALRDLVRATRLDPTDAQLRRVLLDTINQELGSSEHGSADK
ncbi:MAG: CHAT domain-containing protein [Pseudonocardiaceae bacterium]